MKNRLRKITVRILIFVLTIIIILIISFFRYDIFLRQKVHVDRKLRLLEMNNSIFHPFFKTGNVIDYYDSNKISGKVVYEKRRIVKRIRYYENGETWFEIPIKFCSLHGIARHFFENGKVQYEVEYSFGIKNGKAKEYYENGQLKKEIEYRNDIRHGNYVKYDSTGKVMSLEKYNLGLKIE